MQYTYDELNRLTRVQTDDGRVIAYTYDPAGNLLRVDKAAPSLCGQRLDFTGNALPLGWTLGRVRSGPGIVNEALQGWPIDSGSEVISPSGALPPGTRAFVVRFKLNTAYSYWGQGFGIGLQLDSGRVLQFFVSQARYNWGDGNMPFLLADADGYWSAFSNGPAIAPTVVKSGYRHGRHQAEFRTTGTQITATFKNLDAPAILDINHTFALPAGYGLERIRRATAFVYTTTDGRISADDVELVCEPA